MKFQVFNRPVTVADAFDMINRAQAMNNTIGLIKHLGRVTDAEFEVIEPTKDQHGTEQSAGDGIRYDYTGAGRPTAGTGTGIGGHAFGAFTTT